MLKNTKKYLILLLIAVLLLMTVLYQIKLKGEQENIVLSMIVIGTTILMTIISIFICKEKNFDEMIAFRLIIPIITILFVTAMPIFRSHDEDAHWLRIYDISIGNFLTKTEYGSLFQEGAQNYPAAKLPKAVSVVLDKSYAGVSTSEIFDIKIDEEDTVIYAMPTTAIYSPIQYLPQAAGVFIARIFTNRPIVMAYAARIMNILVSFTALYFAMKFMPFGKKILLVLMSIPIALEGFSSLSPDGMTISISFLFIAYILHLVFDKKDEKIKFKQSLLIAFLGVVLALCKIVYLPIVGLVMLLPKEKFKSRKRQVLHIAILILIAIIANLVWLGISSTYLAEYKEGRPVDQLGTLLKDPLNYIEMLIYSIDSNGSKYFLSTLGGEAGLNEYVNMHTFVPIMFFILCILATFGAKEKHPKLSIYQTTIMVLIVLAVVGLIFTSLYIQWTKTESESIMGVQGRYFIPVLPLLLLLLSQLNIKIDYPEMKTIKLITTGILMIQIYVIPIVFCIRYV